MALTEVPNIKFVVIISGGKLKNEALLEKAFSDVYSFPSLHILGKLLIAVYSIADRLGYELTKQKPW